MLNDYHLVVLLITIDLALAGIAFKKRWLNLFYSAGVLVLAFWAFQANSLVWIGWVAAAICYIMAFLSSKSKGKKESEPVTVLAPIAINFMHDKTIVCPECGGKTTVVRPNQTCNYCGTPLN